MSTTITAADVKTGDTIVGPRGIHYAVTDVRRFLNPFKIKVRGIRPDLEWVEPNFKTVGVFDPDDTVERVN